MAKKAVLLLNFGGPNSLREVKPFLFRLFCDPNILAIPTPFRQIVAALIALIKGPSSIRAYEAIGGGSPQLKWTMVQSEGLQGVLTPETVSSLVAQNTKVFFGMRSWRPYIAEAVRDLIEWGADEVTLLPMFPQFSTTTTGSCLKEAYRQLRRQGWKGPVSEVSSWPDQPAYIAVLRSLIEQKISIAKASHKDDPYLLFSAHSLPLSVVKKGDPYPKEVRRTVEAVVRGLDLKWSLAFQSRNGRLPWLEPYIEDELKRLGEQGVRNIVVCPVSFVSDHIETLWELDLLYAEHARAYGIESYHRVATFNGDPRFGRVLAEVLKTATPATGYSFLKISQGIRADAAANEATR